MCARRELPTRHLHLDMFDEICKAKVAGESMFHLQTNSTIDTVMLSSCAQAFCRKADGAARRTYVLRASIASSSVPCL